MIARVCIYAGLDGRIAIIALRRPQPTFSIAKLREVDEPVFRCTATSGGIYRVLLKRSEAFRGCAFVRTGERRRRVDLSRRGERASNASSHRSVIISD